ALISNASYYAVDKIIDKNYDYKQLVNIEKNSDGDVVMLITDSFKVNELSYAAAVNAYKFLDESTEKGVDVPLGAFSGIRLLSGFGAPIKMKLLSVSSVKCNMISEFQNAGINQTRHMLYLNVYSEVSVITKVSRKTVSDSIKILVYDNLVVGKVPEILVTSNVIGSGTYG
ncbi:MAG: sporulation protein YunB, partial [Clostridia bacterium]|nr:sporulation protein YunB [Clostridia bacterium]